MIEDPTVEAAKETLERQKRNGSTNLRTGLLGRARHLIERVLKL